jgi:hypothetical protein
MKDTSVTGVTQNAINYRQKVIQSCNLITRGRQNINILSKVIIAIYANIGEYANVTSANIDQWSAFIEGNILTAIEVVSSVLPIEKTDYDAL